MDKNNENNKPKVIEPLPANVFPDLNNRPLVAAMNALKKNETAETKGIFVAEAVKSAYFTPVDILDADGNSIEGTGKIAIPQDAKFNFKLIKNTNDESFFLLFTDIDEFQKWNKEEKIKTIVVDFPRISRLAMQKADEVRGVVINPMGQNLIFTQELLKAVTDRMNEVDEMVANRQEVRILLGKPVGIPDSVMDSFKKTLEKHKSITAAYFLMMKQDEKESYMFVFDFDKYDDEARKAADTFCNSARLILTKFPIVSAALKSQIGQNAPNVVEPFYKRDA